MQALIKPLLTYLVYPLLKEGAEWAYQKILKWRSDKSENEYKSKRQALKKAIKNAESDDEIKHLSIVLHDLNKLY